MKKGIAIIVAVAFSLSLFAVPVRADQQADFEYRRDYGHFNTVWMNGLIQDYKDERLSEADLLRELYAQRPTQTALLLNLHGTVSNACFGLDIIRLEANQPISFDSSGNPVFFATAQYLDSSGQVISGQESAYNAAVRANSILRDVVVDRAALCPGCPTNNTCCKCDPGCDCDTNLTNGACKIDGFGNCENGCTWCS